PLGFTPGKQTVGKQGVLDQGAAGPGIEGVAPLVVLAVVGTQDAITTIRIRVGFPQRFRSPVEAGTRVELVRTTTADLVDHTTGRTPKLGAVAAGLGLLLGDALERHLHEVQVLEGVGDVEAVEEVLVLGDGRATERSQIAERGVALYRTRSKQGHRCGVARYRDLGDLLGAENRSGLNRGNVDRVDRVAGHGDRTQRGIRATAGEVQI